MSRSSGPNAFRCSANRCRALETLSTWNLSSPSSPPYIFVMKIAPLAAASLIAKWIWDEHPQRHKPPTVLQPLPCPRLPLCLGLASPRRPPGFPLFSMLRPALAAACLSSLIPLSERASGWLRQFPFHRRKTGPCPHLTSWHQVNNSPDQASFLQEDLGL